MSSDNERLHSEPGPEPFDCATTAEAAARFLADELGGAEVARYRAHRGTCEACDEVWRATVATTASLQRRKRTSRLEAERLERRETHRKMALAGMALSASEGSGRSGGRASALGRTKRRAHLRLIALPTLAVVLMAVIYPLSSGRHARLEVLAGEVQLTANTYGVPDPAVPLVRGDQASTRPDGRARIEYRRSSVELGGSTHLVVEDEAGGRFRLDGGSVAVAGECVLTTRFGVVEVAGRARVALVPGGVELESLEGELLATNAEGVRRVPAGSRATLGHPR